MARSDPPSNPSDAHAVTILFHEFYLSTDITTRMTAASVLSPGAAKYPTKLLHANFHAVIKTKQQTKQHLCPFLASDNGLQNGFALKPKCRK
eukprot:scaffold4128_cov70-Cylindrotheca_fusiformis.AAC.2